MTTCYCIKLTQFFYNCTAVLVANTLFFCPRTRACAALSVDTPGLTPNTSPTRYVTISFGQTAKTIFVHHFFFVFANISLFAVCICFVCGLHIYIHIITQVCWYFPLTNQIKRLLQSKLYSHYLKYEFHRREQNDNYMADVYDSPRWAQVAGKMTSDRVTRIVMQLCVDAFPWSSRKHQVICFVNS